MAKDIDGEADVNAAKARAVAQQHVATQQAAQAKQAKAEAARAKVELEMKQKLTKVFYTYHATTNTSSGSMTLSKSSHVIKMPRAKVYAEHTGRADEVANDIKTHYLIRMNESANYPDWRMVLSWERWCKYAVKDYDVHEALATLKSYAKTGYHLTQQQLGGTNGKVHNIIYFNGQDDANAVVEFLNEVLGDRKVTVG